MLLDYWVTPDMVILPLLLVGGVRHPDLRFSLTPCHHSHLGIPCEA